MVQVSKEKAIADKEEEKVAIFAVEVGNKQKACETDLAKAEPALVAAQEALNTLNKVIPERSEIKCQESSQTKLLRLNCHQEETPQEML